ncbi:sialate O-acetylesterase [Clostridium sp. KNHs205]|uniref:sialate O-acetylesterase n=1 Tax=Clostridium sp. KNHs205 TaxID=1449050 RepID=UPI001FA757BC|nr:sialate O-acetylesterase [Clostridium sp. KNHs205]
MNQLTGIINNCHLITTEDLVVEPSDMEWDLHFSHDSEVTLGKRYAEKMIEVLSL